MEIVLFAIYLVGAWVKVKGVITERNREGVLRGVSYTAKGIVSFILSRSHLF